MFSETIDFLAGLKSVFGMTSALGSVFVSIERSIAIISLLSLWSKEVVSGAEGESGCSWNSIQMLVNINHID